MYGNHGDHQGSFEIYPCQIGQEVYKILGREMTSQEFRFANKNAHGKIALGSKPVNEQFLEEAIFMSGELDLHLGFS